MRCPACREDLVIVECEGVELDVCHAGHGLWFDAQELLQLFRKVGAPEGLHDLEERLGGRRAGGDHPPRRCPRCGAKMLAVEAPGGAAAVILDRCPEGDGLWFDRGELEAVMQAAVGENHVALALVKRHLGAFLEPRGGETSPEG